MNPEVALRFMWPHNYASSAMSRLLLKSDGVLVEQFCLLDPERWRSRTKLVRGIMRRLHSIGSSRIQRRINQL